MHISRGELIKVTTELLGADLNAQRLGGAPRSVVVANFTDKEVLKDIIKIAAAMIDEVDTFLNGGPIKGDTYV